MIKAHSATISYLSSGIACVVYALYVIEIQRCRLSLEYVNVLGNLYFSIAFIGLLFGCIHSASLFRQKRLAAFRTWPVLLAILVLTLSVFVPAY